MADGEEYVYSNNEGNNWEALPPEEVARRQAEEDARIAAEERRAALERLVRRTYKASPSAQRKSARRRTAELEQNLAREKRSAVGLNVARATQAYNRIGMDIHVDPVEPLLAALNQSDPDYLELFHSILSTHQEAAEAAKRAAYRQIENARLANLRTNTNASYANFARKIPTIPRAARPAFVLLAQMDDLYGKVSRNLEIAATEAERRRLAEKKYNIGKARTLIHKVMSKQGKDPRIPIPPGLMREVTRLLQGENVAALLAPTVPAANRLAPAIAAFEAEREGRYRTLKNQMNAMRNNEKGREKVTFLAAIEEAMTIVRSQNTSSNAAEAAVNAELARLAALRDRIAAGPIALEDKVKVLRLIQDYKLDKNTGNGLFSRLNTNRQTFNRRNLEAAAAATGMAMVPNVAAAPPPPPPAPLSAAEREARRARAAAAAQARAAGKGGKRRTRKAKN